jgi:hypothetical protein
VAPHGPRSRLPGSHSSHGWTQVPGGEVAAVVVKEAAVAQDEGPRVAQSDLYADFDLFPLLDKIRAVLYSEDC